MSLQDYFEETEGTGILSTADAEGNVDAALYARPHFPEENDETLAFIMSSRTSYDNLQTNSRAAYLFIEEGTGYEGRRLYLRKIDEDSSSETVRKMRKKSRKHSGKVSDKQVVYFEIENERPLVGEW